MKNHDYKVLTKEYPGITALEPEHGGGYIAAGSAKYQVEELARRWNAEPELRDALELAKAMLSKAHDGGGLSDKERWAYIEDAMTEIRAALPANWRSAK